MLWITIKYLLLPLWPSHPSRLRALHDADHLIRDRQFRVNGRSKRMNELWPMVIPQPKHGAAIGTEIPLRRTDFLIRCASRHDGGIFPKPVSSELPSPTVMKNILRPAKDRGLGKKTGMTYLIKSFPFLISRLSAIPPRLTLPLYPPTFRQMLQAHS